MRDDPIEHIRDIFIQELMILNGGEFDDVRVDMDSLAFESNSSKHIYLRNIIR